MIKQEKIYAFNKKKTARKLAAIEPGGARTIPRIAAGEKGRNRRFI